MKIKITRLVYCTMTLFFLLTSITYAEENNIRVIIGFHDEIDESVLENITYEVHHIHETIHAMTVTLPTDELDELKNNSRIKWIEEDPDVTIESQMIDWGYKQTVDINTKKLNISGEGIKIGVIDTGIRKGHPDLKIKGGISFVDGTGSSEYEDRNGHGTHVAGVIGAQDNDIGIVGIAPKADIYAIKVLDRYGNGSQSNIIAGLEWAIEQELDILNLSITSGPYPSFALAEILKKVDENHIIVVAAAGNIKEGMKQVGTDILYPARHSSIISVGAVDSQLRRATFSYTGPSLDFVAPGVNVNSTFIRTETERSDYKAMDGTSMATPFVTGVIALYKEQHPHLNRKQLIKALATNAIDLGVKGKDHMYGYGLAQTPASSFWDINGKKWYVDPIHNLSTAGHIDGYVDGSFKPMKPITRGEVVKMIGKAQTLKEIDAPFTFIDLHEDYFASGYIQAAANEGWVTGYETNEFKPTLPITRADAAIIIRRAFDIPISNSDRNFPDVDRSKYYYEELTTLYEEKIISGYEDGKLQPEKDISRAEFTSLLSRALNRTFR